MSEKKKWQQNKDEYNKQYIKKNIKMYTILLNRNTDIEMIEFIDSQPNKQQFFKGMILKEMKKSK